MQRVRDVMTLNPQTCEMNSSVLDCLTIMRDANCGVVPIVDQEQRVVGVVTDRDIALCLLDHADQKAQDIKLDRCASTDQVITCHPDDDLHRVVKLMEDNQIRRIPVVDPQGRCVGMLSQADIALKDEDRREVTELLQEISKERETIGANP